MIYIGIIAIGLIGAFLHFLYEISGRNKFVAFFAAVNESTWEHIKIGITPTLLWSLYDGYVYGLNDNYILAKSLSILSIILLIPALFYTYTTFTKKSILVVDIICFNITIIISQLTFNYFVNIDSVPFIYTYFAYILLFIEICAYAVLTYNPIENFMFKDPISHKYGIEGHAEHHHHKKVQNKKKVFTKEN